MAWELTGNAGTTLANFLGTTDNQPLVIKTGANSQERLRVDPTGNVGLGTQTPSFPLHVGMGKILRIEGGTSPGDFANYFSFGGYGSFGIDAPGVVNGRFVVQNSGFVGIGTAAPTNPLHLGGGKTLRIEGGVSATDAADYFSFGGYGSFGIDAPGVVNGRFVVQNSGFVGIGTAAPVNRLHIEGGGWDTATSIALHRSENNKFMRFGVGTNGVALDFDSTSYFVIQKNASGINGLFNGPALVTVTPEGNMTVAGDVLLSGADCAEQFETGGSLKLEPGTVVVIDDDGSLRESQSAYDRRVAGVVSGAGDIRHALVLNSRPSETDRVPLALLGRVFCKADATYSPIDVGDLLTTSPTPGHAMAAEPARATGTVLGKALGPLSAGRGLVPILISLQ